MSIFGNVLCQFYRLRPSMIIYGMFICFPTFLIKTIQEYERELYALA